MKVNKVVLVTGIFPPDIGGPASFIPLFAKELVKRNIEVVVVTLSDNVNIETDKNYNFKVIRIRRSISKFVRMIKTVFTISRLAMNRDLIFANTLHFEAAFASIISRKSLILKIVGDIAWERATRNKKYDGTIDEFHLSKRFVFTKFVRTFPIYFSKVIIVPSVYMKKLVGKWSKGNRNIVTIFNNIEVTPVNLQKNSNVLNIISVARLVPHKGLAAIIKAVSKLKFGEYTLHIIGDGPMRKELETLANTLMAHVNFHGAVTKNQVASELCKADIFVLNSSYEGLPHIVLEAMYYRTAVIATAVGGTVEIVKDKENGILIEFNDEKAIYNNIKLLHENVGLRNRLIKSGKIFVQKLTNIDEMVESYIALFNNLSQTEHAKTKSLLNNNKINCFSAEIK